MSSILDASNIPTVSIEELRKAGIVPEDLIRVSVVGNLQVESGVAGAVYDTLGVDLRLQEPDMIPVIEGISIIMLNVFPNGALPQVCDFDCNVQLWDDEPDWEATLYSFEDAQIAALVDEIALFDPDEGKNILAAWQAWQKISTITTSGAPSRDCHKDSCFPHAIPKTPIKDGKVYIAASNYKATTGAFAFSFRFAVHLYIRYVPTTVVERIRELEKENSSK